MIKRLTLSSLLGLAVTAAMPGAMAQQGSLVHTPITDPAAFLANRSNQAAPATAGMPDSSFDIDKAPPEARGVSRPIGGNAAYGHTYTDVAGLYTFVLSQGWSGEPASADRRAFRFWGSSGNNLVACGVTPLDYSRGAASLAELQVIPENAARATFEQGVLDSTGWRSVDSRGVLMIGDGRTPVRALSWSAASADGRTYDTVAIVEATANTVMVMCSASATRPKLPETVIKLAFRLAQGALLSATGAPGQGTARSTVAFNPNVQATVRQMLADGRSRAGGTQQPGASGAAQATDERQRLMAEFDSALARKDRDTIYRIGPKIKDTKFCQYVYNDPAATKQQLYDGASSCPPGPLFDALTQRYIKSAVPQTAQASGPASAPTTTYSAPVRNVESAASHSLRIQRQTDYEIREMNRRIDNAGRR